MALARRIGDILRARKYLSAISAIFLMMSAYLFPVEQSTAHVASRHTSRTLLKGKALDVGISPGGVTYIIGSKGKVWRWGSSFGEEWSYVEGNDFLRIDIGPDNSPWAVDRNGGIFFHNSAYWEKRGEGAVDIGVGPKGVVLALLKNGWIVGWNPARKRFDRFLAGKGRRIDVDEKGLPWIVNHEGRLAYHTGKAWRVFGTKARDVSVGPGGNVFVARDNGTVVHHLNSAISQQINGFTRIVSVAAGPKGHLWAVREDQTIVSMSLFEKERGVEPPATAHGPARPSMAEILNKQRRRRSSVDTSIITSNAPLEFVLVSGIRALDIGIGADGSVFASDTNGIFKRFSERERVFLTFPGQISAVAVDAQGNPWGVTPSGKVFRHNGTDWEEVLGAFKTARDIAINYRNAVFITDVDRKVFRFDEETNRFILFPGLKGARIAVNPKGQPWTVDRDGAVFRCDADSGCSRTPVTKALDISIGPDGSIFITSTANALLRYNAREGKFEFLPRIGAGVRDVEVGPRGRPWVIDINGLVYASGFFKRDETDDAQTAKTTRTETSDVPTIVFTKQLSLPGFTDVKRRIPDAGTVRASRNGEVLVTADDGAIWRFISSRKRFVKKAITAPLVTQSFGPPFPITAISPDGRLVYLESIVGAGTTTHKIFRQRKINRTGVELLTELTLDSDNVDGRIHVGPEGIVYFSIIEDTTGKSLLFIMPTNKKVLKEFDIAAAGIDPIANFLELSGGGREGVLQNVFFNLSSGKTAIEILKFKISSGKSATQIIRGTRFEKVFETTKEIVGFSSSEKSFYACIDEVLSRFNEKRKRFDRTNIKCVNIAVTPEQLIFYIKP